MGSAMGAKYQIGQKVIIRPVNDKAYTSRESDIDTYAGQVGEVSNFFWISPRTSEIFYIYNVRVGSGYKELVLYEDELEVCLA